MALCATCLPFQLSKADEISATEAVSRIQKAANWKEVVGVFSRDIIDLGAKRLQATTQIEDALYSHPGMQEFLTAMSKAAEDPTAAAPVPVTTPDPTGALANIPVPPQIQMDRPYTVFCGIVKSVEGAKELAKFERIQISPILMEGKVDRVLVDRGAFTPDSIANLIDFDEEKDSFRGEKAEVMHAVAKLAFSDKATLDRPVMLFKLAKVWNANLVIRPPLSDGGGDLKQFQDLVATLNKHVMRHYDRVSTAPLRQIASDVSVSPTSVPTPKSKK